MAGQFTTIDAMGNRRSFTKSDLSNNVFDVDFGLQVKPLTQALFCFIDTVRRYAKNGSYLPGGKMQPCQRGHSLFSNGNITYLFFQAYKETWIDFLEKILKLS